MRIEARLHLPGGPRQLGVPAGGLLEISAEEAARLADRVDRRDRILLAGRRIDRRRTAGRVRRGLALIASAPVAGAVSVRDHLAAVTTLRRAEALVAASPLLAGRGRDPAGVLSGGERRVLAVLRAVAVQPRAVVLDRAGEGLDPDGLDWVAERITTWRRDGVAVLVRPGRAEEYAWLDAPDVDGPGAAAAPAAGAAAEGVDNGDALGHPGARRARGRARATSGEAGRWIGGRVRARHGQRSGPGRTEE